MKTFTVQCDDGLGGEDLVTTTAAELIDANSDDPEVVDFVVNANPGDARAFGGGAAPLFEVRCVS